MKEKLENITKKIGLVKMIKMMGGFGSFQEKVGDFNFLNDYEIITAIRDCYDICGAMATFELDIDPIVRFVRDGETHQIEFFGSRGVTVQVISYLGKDEGEYQVHYENLKRNELIFILYSYLDYMDYHDLI
jgi:hypothetical protein